MYKAGIALEGICSFYQIHSNSVNTFFIFIGTLIRICKPYSQDACEKAAENLNLTYISSGDYGTKGCYAYKPDHNKYANNVYYSYTGSDDEKKRPLHSSSIYRPDGFDCKSINALTDLRINYKIKILSIDIFQ